MGSITTGIPNLNINMVVDNISMLKDVHSVQLAGNKLIAQVKDGLSDAKYNEIAKQLRIVFSISFEQVYSEDYEVSYPGNGIGYGGHNERKNHLLSENLNFEGNFLHTSQLIFQDLLGTLTSITVQTRFFNLAYIWTRAHELEDLKLLTEAYVQYWRILDEFHNKGTKSQSLNALRTFGLEENKSNIFAAQVLAGISREQRKSAVGEIADIANLDRLRHPHAHQAGGRRKYYLEDETHIEAKTNNWLISDITKLFILWQIGLNNYYLNPRANIYEIKKAE
jgi:hypothetical protein